MDGTYELFRHFFGQPPRAADDGDEIGAARGVLLSVVGMLAEGATPRGGGHRPRHRVVPQRPLARLQDRRRDRPRSCGPSSTYSRPPSTPWGSAVWPMVELEADDALASAASVAAEDPAVERVIICTPDKDLAQCVVGKRVVQLDRRKGTITDEDGVWDQVRRRPPARFPTGSALVGDSADGFPGLAGWGRRSASVVLAHYGSIDDVPDDVARLGSGRAPGGAGRGQAGRTAGRRARPGRAVPGPRHPPDGPDRSSTAPASLSGAGPTPEFEDVCRHFRDPALAERAAAICDSLTRGQPVLPKTSASSVGTGVSSWA